MLAEITGLKENELELKIEEEDISVMYIIQYELLKETAVEFAGVILKHPLIKDYMMRVLTKGKDLFEPLMKRPLLLQNMFSPWGRHS